MIVISVCPCKVLCTVINTCAIFVTSSLVTEQIKNTNLIILLQIKPY